jgi:hypothetical protein
VTTQDLRDQLVNELSEAWRIIGVDADQDAAAMIDRLILFAEADERRACVDVCEQVRDAAWCSIQTTAALRQVQDHIELRGLEALRQTVPVKD